MDGSQNTCLPKAGLPTERTTSRRLRSSEPFSIVESWSWLPRWRSLCEVRQLSNVGSDPPRVVGCAQYLTPLYIDGYSVTGSCGECRHGSGTSDSVDPSCVCGRLLQENADRRQMG